MSDRLDRLEQRIEETHAIAVAAQTAMDALCLELISDDLIDGLQLANVLTRLGGRYEKKSPGVQERLMATVERLRTFEQTQTTMDPDGQRNDASRALETISSVSLLHTSVLMRYTREQKHDVSVHTSSMIVIGYAGAACALLTAMLKDDAVSREVMAVAVNDLAGLTSMKSLGDGFGRTMEDALDAAERVFAPAFEDLDRDVDDAWIRPLCVWSVRTELPVTKAGKSEACAAGLSNSLMPAGPTSTSAGGQMDDMPR